jgi:putative sigma-54 modulation protein
MDVQVRGQNLDVTEALQSYLDRKLHKLDRYPGVGAAQARMAVDGEAHVVEVTLPVDGRVLRAEASSEDMYASIDVVTDRLLHQIQKYRGRTVAKAHSAGRAPEASDLHLVHVPGGMPEEVVRVKRFPAESITVDEAVVRLELVDHDFYAFREANSQDVCVIYRRHGGGYGLLIPEALSTNDRS